MHITEFTFLEIYVATILSNLKFVNSHYSFHIQRKNDNTKIKYLHLCTDLYFLIHLCMFMNKGVRINRSKAISFSFLSIFCLNNANNLFSSIKNHEHRIEIFAIREILADTGYLC